MLCVHCGSDNPDGTKHCLTCGHRLARTGSSARHSRPPDGPHPPQAPQPEPARNWFDDATRDAARASGHHRHQRRRRRRHAVRQALLTGTAVLAALTVVGLVFWVWAPWARSSGTGPARPTGLQWVKLPAGAFEMGCVPSDQECHSDEYPRHRVSLSRGFQMLATEVTVAQMTAAGYRVPAQTWSTDQHPALNITWLEAQAFCEGVGGRLPTEAEWEYAARGGHEGSKYPWGSLPPTCLMRAPNGARVRDCGEGAEPVQTYAPNGYGLYDMAGNASEWLLDWYDPHYYESSPQSDPSGPQGGRRRVVRGGSWFGNSREIRVSSRGSYVPEQRFIHTGFRCVREVG